VLTRDPSSADRATAVSVGLQLVLHGSFEELEHDARRADREGLGSLWVTDHFTPQWGPPDQGWFECWTALGAVARLCPAIPTIGTLVSCTAFRDPELLALMARSVDAMSDGRLVVGLGAGWSEPDFDACRVPFGTAGDRARSFAGRVRRVADLLDGHAAGSRRIPLLLAGEGERTTLPLVAERADLWCSGGPFDIWHERWERVRAGVRDVGRSAGCPLPLVNFSSPAEFHDAPRYVECGVRHFAVMRQDPTSIEDALRLRDELAGG
jgi:alkanesulfonate monooxygenase SsuD/methylene tetrahydromethanopterin reductase-like flavin-dependent oxidoreductase (luciferase family)